MKKVLGLEIMLLNGKLTIDLIPKAHRPTSQSQNLTL
jgi:hypothetical protein